MSVMGKGRTFLTITSIASVCLIQFYWGARTQNNLFVPLPSDETQTIITNKPQKIVYQPADTEKDIMIIANKLGFNKKIHAHAKSGMTRTPRQAASMIL